MENTSSLGQRPRLLLQGGARSFRLSPFEMVILACALVVASAGGYSVYARSTDLNAKPAPPPVYIPASRTTLTSTVSSTGTVQATQQVTLTFGATGKIKEFLVGLGAQVTAGQPLARLDDSDLQQAVQSAQSALASAQARLAAANKGPTDTDIATGQQAVTSAQGQLATAQQNLADLKAKPTKDDITAAQQAVNTAQNALQTAQDAIPKAQNDLAGAQNAVSTAQAAITTAQNNVASAQNGIATAQNNLTAAQNDLASAQNDVNAKLSALGFAQSNLQGAIIACNPVKGSPTAAPGLPANGSPAATMNPLSFDFACSGGAPSQAVSQWIGTYNSNGGAYNSSLSTLATKKNAVTTAGNAVTAAQNGVTSAQASLTKAQNDLESARNTAANADNALHNGNLQRAVQNAQLGVSSAQQNYRDTLAGAKKSDIDAAQRAVDSASAALASAQSKYDDLFKPPEPDVILPLQAAVDQASANLEAAKKDLAGATIVAPFDGQISQLTGEVGSQVSANTAVFILLNPRLIRVDANVDQADISNLQPGQTANLTFDALSGRTYQAVVSAIGLTPTVQNGVVTYVVSLAVDTSRLPQGAPVPTPGMTAAITVTTSRTDNALVVPSRSIKRVGRTSTVTVKTPTGDEQRQVTTGSSNGTLTQITGGLQDGDEVLYSAPVTSTSATNTTNRPNTFGGPGGGGQFFAIPR